ncbi:hypothetical protein GCM10009600_34120 [Oerskovia paurometabola]
MSGQPRGLGVRVVSGVVRVTGPGYIGMISMEDELLVISSVTQTIFGDDRRPRGTRSAHA